MNFTHHASRITLAFCFLLSAFCFPLSGADLISATVTFTNTAGTTNGQTITLNGSVRTWTNSVVSPSSQILTNSASTGSASNLFAHLGASPVTGTAISYGSSTSVVVRGFPSIALTVTLSDGYGEVAYSTNTLTTATVLRLPVTVESAAQQTNLTTRLVDALNLTAPTNQLMQSSPAFAQFVGTTNAQTIAGEKTWTGTNVFTGQFTLTNSRAIIRMGDALSQKTLVITNASDTELTLENTGAGGGFDSPGQRLLTISSDGSVGTPSWGDGVQIDGQGIINLAASNLVGIVPTASLVNGANLTNLVYAPVLLASTGITIITNTLAGTGQKTYTHSADVSTAAHAAKTGTNETRSVTITNAANQFRGTFNGSGSISNLTTTGTNSFSDIAFRRYAITSLANGNNFGVVVGTNTYVEVSGPSAAFAILGLNGSPNRDGHVVIIDNNTGFAMTIAVEGGATGNDPTDTFRITSNTGADRATTGNGTAIFVYKASTSRWKLISFDP